MKFFFFFISCNYAQYCGKSGLTVLSTAAWGRVLYVCRSGTWELWSFEVTSFRSTWRAGRVRQYKMYLDPALGEGVYRTVFSAATDTGHDM